MMDPGRGAEAPPALPSSHPELFPAIFNHPTPFWGEKKKKKKSDFVEGQREVICLTLWSSLLPVGLRVEPARQCPGIGAFFIILLQWKHTVLQLAGEREKEPEGPGIIKRMQ